MLEPSLHSAQADAYSTRCLVRVELDFLVFNKFPDS